MRVYYRSARTQNRCSTRTPRTPTSSLRRILEADGPVRAIAEWLVLRGATAAQRVVLAGSAVAELHPQQFYAAGDSVGTVVGHRDHRRALRRRAFDAVYRIAQGA